MKGKITAIGLVIMGFACLFGGTANSAPSKSAEGKIKKVARTESVVAQKLNGCEFWLNKNFKKDAKYYLCLFSASWCPPCRREMPRISKTYSKMIKNNPDVELIHFSFDTDKRKAIEWANEHNVEFPVVMDGRFNPLDLKARGIPHLFIVKADGTVVESGHPVRLFTEEKIRELSKFSEPEIPRILGHRGSRGEYQDNGVGAFKRVLDAGGTGFEVDIRLSADGHLIVMHDASVARTTGEKGIVEKMTLAEIKKLRLVNCSEPVPTIQEVMQVLKGRKDVFIELEMKSAAATKNGRLGEYCDKLYAAAKELLEPGTYAFTSFDEDYLKTMKKRHADAPIGLIRSKAISEEFIARAKKLGCSQIAPLMEGSTAELVKKAHDEGLRVTLWMVQSIADWNKAKELGADNCTSDYPILLLQRVKGKKKKLVALDLDATLCQHRTPVPSYNVEVLKKLQEKYHCVMVGAGNAPRIYRQMNQYPIEIIGNYGMQEAAIVNGKFKIVRAVTNTVDKNFFLEKTDYLRKKYGYTKYSGKPVEFHASGMVTFGLLGTSAEAERKVTFDPNRKKRRAMYPEVCEIFKDFSVYIGGSTSFDFAGKEYNKYDAVVNWAKRRGYEVEDIVFVGDDFADGGGDSHARIKGMDLIVINDYRYFPQAMAVLLED